MVDVRVALPYLLPGELVAWVEEQAEVENIEPAKLLERALMRERHRLDPEARPVDARTKRPGVRGASARVGAGEFTGSAVAEVAGVSPSLVSTLVRDGVLAPEDPGRRGFPSRWTLAQARAALVIFALRGLAPDLLSAEDYGALFSMLAAAASTMYDAGRFLVICERRADVVARGELGRFLSGRAGCAAVVELAQVSKMPGARAA